MTQQQLFSQFSEGELATLKKAIGILGKLFPEQEKPKQNRGWRVRQSTRDFMDELHAFYGNQWIYRYDDQLLNVCRKHNVLELRNWIRMYDQAGLIEVVRVQNANKNIVKFRFV
jgi:GH25 family lysozyme M1 (1,4-beta-N-acetylmuramidase)